MNKIFIIGIVASGKTTLARTLSQQLHVPWYELDSIVHRKTRTRRYKRTAAEQVEVIMKIDQTGSWIFEGTDRDSYQCLYDMADTIIFLDTPLWKRRIRIATRFIRQRLGIEKCGYTPDLNMLRMMYKWTRDFEQNRDSFEEKLARYPGKVVRVRDGGVFAEKRRVLNG
ncbi:hypothetical protein C2I18_20025 [Paenibacillus sp. PK3_47]|uniref:hypothetical protein n=1 Tax=Paenibacillus sp. PK3_47 TaxID=2072642 RepID=UPI00201E3950|nr:hypothetical protein [Paenibacillus sp. PK3_47]UQZ35607.1 hypothetical protein C2I18_20025 [Paenibacillus sp. PK3_47]